jgi:hypothetical protein
MHYACGLGTCDPLVTIVQPSTPVIKASPRVPNIFFPKHGVLQLLKNIARNKEGHLEEFPIIHVKKSKFGPITRPVASMLHRGYLAWWWLCCWS